MAKRKAKTRRKRLEQATENRCMKFYRGLCCVICKRLGKRNTNTCGHHIVRRSRCRPGLYNPRNIIPLCPEHHTYGNTVVTEGPAIPVARYIEFMQRYMPRRWAAAEELDADAKRNSGRKMPIEEIEADHDFWEAIDKQNRSYEFVCETVDVEAWAEAADGK